MRHQPVPSVRARRRRTLLVRLLTLTALTALLVGWARRAHTPESPAFRPATPAAAATRATDATPRAMEHANPPARVTVEPRTTTRAPVQDVPSAEDKENNCERGIDAANGLGNEASLRWCSLHAPFVALMAERADPEHAGRPHEQLCTEANEALERAEDLAQEWGDCGAMAEHTLDWADTAWMTGCLPDGAWMEHYRVFRLNRARWRTGGRTCDTTRQAWADEHTERESRLDAVDLSEFKLCVFVALKVFAPGADDTDGLTEAVNRCYVAYPDPGQMVPFDVP